MSLSLLHYYRSLSSDCHSCHHHHHHRRHYIFPVAWFSQWPIDMIPAQNYLPHHLPHTLIGSCYNTFCSSRTQPIRLLELWAFSSTFMGLVVVLLILCTFPLKKHSFDPDWPPLWPLEIISVRGKRVCSYRPLYPVNCFCDNQFLCVYFFSLCYVYSIGCTGVRR